MKYYICNHCGNVVERVVDKGVPIICCGETMPELVPGAVDAATEKHVPVVTVEGNLVKVAVGEVEHPMLDEHFIGFISIETEKGVYLRKNLKAGDKPVAEFALADGDKVLRAYEWCNLHGLWVKEL